MSLKSSPNQHINEGNEEKQENAGEAIDYLSLDLTRCQKYVIFDND